MAQCPVCGARLLLVAESGGATGRSRPAGVSSDSSGVVAYEMAQWIRGEDGALVRVFPPATSTPSKGQELSYRHTPVREPSVGGHFVVPMLWSLGSGVLGAAGAFAISLGAGVEKPGAVACGALVGVTGLVWRMGLKDARDNLWQTEEYRGKDLDGDGYVGEPPGVWTILRGALQRKLWGESSPEPPRNGANRGVIRPVREPLPDDWHDLSATAQVGDVLKFADVVWERQKAGLGTGQKALRGLALPSGFELDDGLHGEMFGLLHEAGLARVKGRGWELTPGCRRDFLVLLHKAIRVEAW